MAPNVSNFMILLTGPRLPPASDPDAKVRPTAFPAQPHHSSSFMAEEKLSMGVLRNHSDGVRSSQAGPQTFATKGMSVSRNGHKVRRSKSPPRTGFVSKGSYHLGDGFEELLGGRHAIRFINIVGLLGLNDAAQPVGQCVTEHFGHRICHTCVVFIEIHHCR